MKNNPHGKSVRILCGMVERAGFEPAKAMPADLQSAPFGQLGYLSNPLFLLSNRTAYILYNKNQSQCQEEENIL